jgi:hypothetical protein
MSTRSLVIVIAVVALVALVYVAHHGDGGGLHRMFAAIHGR